MGEIGRALLTAIELLWQADSALIEIILLSLEVGLLAVAISALIGLPLGAAVALGRFPGRRVVVVALNTLMGLPPVVVGLIVYLILSRSGPLGVLGLLFTPAAMVIAQTLLVTPIIAALARQILSDLWEELGEQLSSLGVSRLGAVPTLLFEGRFSLLTAVLAGFGRASAEVGAVMIVGGNIEHATRVMTTAIALETSKGNLVMALALGIVLLTISLTANGLAFLINDQMQARQG
ncbi:MAG: ABC transporter permease [Geminicoccaceae bacterium]